MIVLAAAAVLVAVSGAPKGNAACWGDDARQDITCARITTDLILRMRYAAKATVTAAMGVSGRRFDEDHWHFVSNYGRGRGLGAGAVNFIFDQEGRAVAVFGEVDSQPKFLYFSWNADGSFCSDLPGIARRCSD